MAPNRVDRDKDLVRMIGVVMARVDGVSGTARYNPARSDTG
jgi:hypothetical protein